VIAPSSFHELREAYRRGDATWVLENAQRVLDQLEGDPKHRELVPAVLVIAGGAFAGREQYLDAIAYLDRGLELLPDTASIREIGSGETFALIEIDLLLLVGRFHEAWAIVPRLTEPDRPLEARLGATRAHIALAATFGDFDTAQQLLNTAAGLAAQVHNRQQAAIVDGDRAVVLALQGRVLEAAAFADQVLPKLAQRGRTPHLAWGVAQAITVATTIARQAADLGDEATAERFLAGIGAVATGSGRAFDTGQIALARGAVWRAGGHLIEAEEPLAAARRQFLELACAPAAAMAQLEEARLAMARGYQASSRPLFERARSEFAALGMQREVARIDRTLASAAPPPAP
jgi:tetratricopeptide (TPR) repeat protein